ncbi:hypothetical protein [Nocardia salmonicida]|uniref:hypothetical protein n=1 Tax=Nocardia salmonicida TaxID=53431 RepID=UPI003CF44EB3
MEPVTEPTFLPGSELGSVMSVSGARDGQLAVLSWSSELSSPPPPQAVTVTTHTTASAQAPDRAARLIRIG